MALDPKDNIATYTIRYQPEKEWFLENGIENLANFTGKISYFSDDNTLFWEAELLNGRSIKDHKSSLKTESEFEISISYWDCDCHSTHASGGCTHPIMVISISGPSGPQIPYYSGGGGSGGPGNPSGGGGGSTPVNSPTLKEMAIFQIDACMEIDGLTGFLETLDKVKLLDLMQYLDENGCVIETQRFASLALEAWDNDGVADGVVDFEDKIINVLEGKALCIYNKLKSSSTGFKNAIKKFEPEFPVAHLKFEMRDIDASYGRTVAPNSNPRSANSPDYVITVLLNNNSTSSGVIKRPNLLVAKTIAHEVIHAEMYRKLLSVLDNGGNIDGVTDQDILDALDGNFPGMYDYYRRHKNWQHQQMATHYRETLARILQEYDTGVAVPANQQPAQLYMDLSWEGLRYPSIYTWTSLPQT